MKALLYSCLIIISSFSIISSQYIVDSAPTDLVSENLKRDFQLIAQGEPSLKLWQYGLANLNNTDISYVDANSTINIRNINYTSLVMNLDNSQVYVSNETIWSYWLSGKNLNLEIHFDFEYNFNSTEFTKGNFVLNFNNFYIFFNKDFNMTMNLNEVEYKIKNVTNEEIIIKALESNQKLVNNLQKVFQDGIKKWFMNKQSQVDAIIFETNFPSQQIYIDFSQYVGLCRGVASQEVVLCPYSASINSKVDTNLIEQALDYEDFLHSSDDYKVFLNYNLFNDIFNQMTRDNSFQINLNQNNKPQNLPFNFDIQSLGQLVPQLYDMYSRGSKLIFSNVVNQINLSNPTNQKSAKGIMTITTNVVLEDSTNVFSFKYNLSFAVISDVLGGKFNLCLHYVDSVTKLQIMAGLRVNSLSLMKNWIMSVFTNYLDSNDFCLAKDSLNLNKYFKYISSTVQGRNGLYLIGKSLYQSVLQNDKKLGFLQ